LRKLHHINLVVPDLDAAADVFAKVLDTEAGPVESLPARGVQLRRFELDGLWLVLVTPVRDDSPAAAWLSERGPGLFLMSFYAADLDAALAALATSGIEAAGPARDGLDDWRVTDLDTLASVGVALQLTESSG
jgi:methylmalonyl-CoA/ethylmalonyl-CoA epimerase